MHSRTIAKLTERRKVDEIEGCTFKPKVTSVAAHMSRSTKHQTIHDVLFAEASIQREKQRQKLIENPKPTFAPDLKLTAGSIFSKRSQMKVGYVYIYHTRAGHMHVAALLIMFLLKKRCKKAKVGLLDMRRSKQR